MNHALLKKRQRNERDGYQTNMALRVHRALSWLERAEQCEDVDARFIFLWIAFNAALGLPQWAAGRGSVDIPIRAGEGFRPQSPGESQYSYCVGHCSACLGKLVPFIIKLMMDNPGTLWGEPCYPVVDV